MQIAESDIWRHLAMIGPVAAMVVASACSGAANSPGNPGNGGGTVQIPGGAGKTFVPDGIVYEDISAPGTDRTGFKLLAATLRDYGNLQELFMTVENMGTEAACQPQVATEVDDASMNTLGGGSLLLNGQMYQVPGGITVCLGAGEIGIGSLPVITDPVQTAPARIRYQFGASLEPTASKLADVTIEGVTIADAAGPMATVTGHLVNHGAAAVQNVFVTSYAIDGATLRAYAQRPAGVDSIAPGAQWNFTIQMGDPIADSRTFVNYVQP